MKKRAVIMILSILTIFFLSFALMSYYPSSFKVREKHVLTKEALYKLVNQAFNDPICQLITEKDIDRIINRLSTINSKENSERNHNLFSSNKFSTGEINYILSQVGFKNIKDYTIYVKLFSDLCEKFGINDLGESDKKLFFTNIRAKQIENIFDKEFSKNKIISKINFGPGGPGGIRPECWKCVQDYINCLQPYIGTVQTQFSGSMIVSLLNSSGNIFMTTSSSPSSTTILYINNNLTQQQCNDWYRTCIAGCNN